MRGWPLPGRRVRGMSSLLVLLLMVVVVVVVVVAAAVAAVFFLILAHRKRPCSPRSCDRVLKHDRGYEVDLPRSSMPQKNTVQGDR